MVDEIDVCNRALQMIGSRNDIAGLTDENEEAKNCNLLYTQIRDQILSMARWNFARRSFQLQLIKAAPGTPESIAPTATNGWLPLYQPIPPWLYEYKYPDDCVFFNYLVGQFTNSVAGDIPIFSTPSTTYLATYGGTPARFIVATDSVGNVFTITGITKANPAVVTAPAHGCSNGDSVYITGCIGMPEINNQEYTVANKTDDTFELSGVNSTTYGTMLGAGAGVNLSSTFAQSNVILTNVPGAIGVYTARIETLNLWSADAIQALVSALAGFLAIPLTRDKSLANMMLIEANQHIIQARANDGNEGLTLQDRIPDWIAVRTDFIGLETTPFIAPYPPLFAVS